MRPTISEQLRQTARLLEDVVAPDLTSEYSARVLRGLVKNLRMLETSWDQVVPFLQWDNEETSKLLDASTHIVPAALAARLAARPSELPDPLDACAVQKHNYTIRGLLSEAISEIDPASDHDSSVRNAITTHLKKRTSRYPMRMVPELAQSEA